MKNLHAPVGSMRICAARPAPSLRTSLTTMGLWTLWCLMCWLLAMVLGVSAAQGAEPANEKARPAEKIPAEHLEFFEKEVRPLLVKHCYECHSSKSDELKGGLALDSRTGWQEGGDSGPAIEPGNPDDSLFIQAVRYETYEMPPQGKLSAEEIAVFEKWVKLGAPDPREGEVARKSSSGLDLQAAREFWSFQLPEAHRPPAVKDTAWPQTEIDAFVLARLEEAGLKPSPDADKLTWLRRVTYDLTGLPPTPEDAKAFLADNSPQARAKVVDRLLASEQFGVHWGRHWLDVARYADSNGSDFNATFFNAWRYRNYVIDAFNHDKPYDQFVREQIAGDLMPYSSDEQRAEQLIATTFVNIGPKMLSERDKEKLVMDVVDEQIDSLGKAFLGMTIGCARCHDHKFDPIPTADYYALAGIFKSTITLEGESQQYVSAWKETPLPIAPEHAEALAAHKQVVDQLKGQIAKAKQELKSAETRLAQLQSNSNGVMVDDADAKKVGQWTESRYSPNFVGKGYIHDERSGKGEKSVTFTPKLSEAGKYEVRLAFAGGGGRDAAVPVRIRHAQGETVIKVDQSAVPPIDKLFKSLGTFEFEAGEAGSVTVSTEGTTGYVIADAVQFIPERKSAEVAKSDSPELKKTNKEVNSLRKELASLEAKLKDVEKNAPPPAPTAMATREAPKIEDCQICIRGEIKIRGPKVKRGFIQVMSNGPVEVENPDQSGRLELANWIARPDHPLTARVMVNRIWQHVFGEGLVGTVDNFGHLGELPSHPQLLDTLAVQFVESGWSVKSMVRQLVLSRTYLQSSQHNAKAMELDPDNRLLWRAHRKRLPAESLRDSLLAISGQLDLSSGDSPVQGLGYLAIGNSNQSSSGRKTDIQRRSIFLPIIRNELPTFLTVFDFADPDVVTGRRAVTNVPAQALFLLNDPFVQQQAEATAERLLNDVPQPEGDKADAKATANRIESAYQLILCRDASDYEVSRAAAYIDAVSAEQSPQEAWRQFVQALFASTEFRMLN